MAIEGREVDLQINKWKIQCFEVTEQLEKFSNGPGGLQN